MSEAHPEPPSIESLLRKCGELQMMPDVARKLMDMASREDVNAQQIAEVVEKDSAITSKVLRISNSAFFGLRAQVKTIQHAVMIMGLLSLRNLVLASSANSIHKKFEDFEKSLWDKSIAVGLVGRCLSKKLHPPSVDLVFVAGILHNLGQAIMNNIYPKFYQQVIEKLEKENLDLLKTEASVFHYTNEDVGFAVAKEWGLPKDLAKMIRFQNLSLLEEKNKEMAASDQDVYKAIAVLELSKLICRENEIGFNDRISLSRTESISFKVFGLEEQSFESLASESIEELEKDRENFQ